MFKKYRIHEIEQRIDRDKSTIIRWENLGLIPKAKRDSRGWRIYSGHEVDAIAQQVHRTNYFREKDVALQPISKTKVFSRASIALVALYMVYNLMNLGFNSVMAFSNQTTTMFTTVSAGILDLPSSSSSDSFSGVNVSFSAQTSTLTKMGAFQVSDARGSGAGWTVNLSANDWKSGQDVMQLDYNGTGSDGNLGKMCLIVTSGAIRSSAGQDTTNISKGGADCFSATMSQIDVYTASSSYGKGQYWITDFSLQQYIPSNPTAQSLTTTIVLTIS